MHSQVIYQEWYLFCMLCEGYDDLVWRQNALRYKHHGIPSIFD